MKIYHGSKLVIKKPLYKGSNEHNDYGPAFYATQELAAAQEWAGRQDSAGIVNEYFINIKGLKILDLTDKTKINVLTWLSILMHYRELQPQFKKDFASRLKWLENKYFINVEQYDVIIGFRADDAYFAFPLEFVRGNMIYEDLEKVFMLGNLGKQVVIISQKAINKIQFIGFFESEPKYVGKYKERLDIASVEFRNLFTQHLDNKGTRIGDLMDEN